MMSIFHMTFGRLLMFFRKVVFNFLYPFSYEGFRFEGINFMNTLCILDINPLHNMLSASIFPTYLAMFLF